MSPEVWGVVGVIGAAVVGGVFTLLANRRQRRSVLDTTNAGDRIDLLRRLAELKKQFSTRDLRGKSEQSVRTYVGQAQSRLTALKNQLDAFDASIAANLFSVVDNVDSTVGGYKKIVDATTSALLAAQRKIKSAT